MKELNSEISNPADDSLSVSQMPQLMMRQSRRTSQNWAKEWLMTSSINRNKTMCLQKNKSKPCQCATESRTGNYSSGQSSQSHCRQVFAIIGSAHSNTELNKTQKNAKHHQGRVENKMGRFILLHKKNRTHLHDNHCVQFCSLPL